MSSSRPKNRSILRWRWPTCIASSISMWPLFPVGQSWIGIRYAWTTVRSSTNACCSGSAPNCLIPPTLLHRYTDIRVVTLCHSMRLITGLLLRMALRGMEGFGQVGDGCVNEQSHQHRTSYKRSSLACSGAWRGLPSISWLSRRSVVQYTAFHGHQFSMASCRSGPRGCGG
jgi:hypothetical protein